MCRVKWGGKNRWKSIKFVICYPLWHFWSEENNSAKDKIVKTFFDNVWSVNKDTNGKVRKKKIFKHLEANFSYIHNNQENGIYLSLIISIDTPKLWWGYRHRSPLPSPLLHIHRSSADSGRNKNGSPYIGLFRWIQNRKFEYPELWWK